MNFPSILLCNARSIKNKFSELLILLNDNSPDITIVTESWIDEFYPSKLLQIDSYYVFRAGGGGIVIWSKVLCDVLPVTIPDTIKSDLLVLRVKAYNILLIAICHPYWKNMKSHSILLEILNNVVDMHLLKGKMLAVSYTHLTLPTIYSV